MRSILGHFSVRYQTSNATREKTLLRSHLRPELLEIVYSKNIESHAVVASIECPRRKWGVYILYLKFATTRIKPPDLDVVCPSKAIFIHNTPQTYSNQ
jgi:hypothetical protein